jgi:hypothetical protein
MANTRLQKLSEAGAAVLVELRGLYPDARPLSGDEVVAALPEGDLVLSYLGSEKTLVLATAFEERTSGLVVSPDADGIRQIQAVASRVRVWIATRLQSNDDYGGEAAARELLRILLPDEALALARKARRLVVLPDGPLNDIPFDLLLALSGDAELEGKAVVHAASATVYLNRLRAPERPGPQTLSALVVADPLYEREPRPGAKYPEAGALIAQVLPGTSAAELESIAAQLSGVVEAADEFATMRRWAAAVPVALDAALDAIRNGDLSEAEAQLALAREAHDAVAGWDVDYVTLPIWIETGDATIDAVEEIVAAARAGRTAEAQRLADEFAELADEAVRADRALQITISEGGGLVAAAPLARLAAAIRAVDDQRAAVADLLAEERRGGGDASIIGLQRRLVYSVAAAQKPT